MPEFELLPERTERWSTWGFDSFVGYYQNIANGSKYFCSADLKTGGGVCFSQSIRYLEDLAGLMILDIREGKRILLTKSPGIKPIVMRNKSKMLRDAFTQIDKFMKEQGKIVYSLPRGKVDTESDKLEPEGGDVEYLRFSNDLLIKLHQSYLLQLGTLDLPDPFNYQPK